MNCSLHMLLAGYPSSPGSLEAAPARRTFSCQPVGGRHPPCPAPADTCMASLQGTPRGLLTEGPSAALLPGIHRLAPNEERRMPAAHEIWAAE